MSALAVDATVRINWPEHGTHGQVGLVLRQAAETLWLVSLESGEKIYYAASQLVRQDVADPMISIWIVQLRDADGVALARADVPVAGRAPEVQIDPIALFGGDAPGPGRVLSVRREDGSETLFPCNTARPVYFQRFNRSALL